MLLAISLITSLLAVCILLRRLDKSSKACEELKKRYNKLYSQKKSSEVRLGQIAEQFIPVLKDFEHDPKKARFIGSPIDYIVFEEEEIVFIEYKTGNSQLNKNQERVKQLINEKKVRWKELRTD